MRPQTPRQDDDLSVVTDVDRPESSGALGLPPNFWMQFSIAAEIIVIAIMTYGIANIAVVTLIDLVQPGRSYVNVTAYAVVWLLTGAAGACLTHRTMVRAEPSLANAWNDHALRRAADELDTRLSMYLSAGFGGLTLLLDYHRVLAGFYDGPLVTIIVACGALMANIANVRRAFHAAGCSKCVFRRQYRGLASRLSRFMTALFEEDTIISPFVALCPYAIMLVLL